MSDKPHVETTPEQIPEEAKALLDSVEVGEQAAPPAEQQPRIPTAALIAPLVALFCNVVAPAWAINDAEQKTLADAYAAVVDKYFPDGVPMGPEVGALMVTAAVIMPRIGRPMKEPEPEKRADEEA